MSTFFSVIGYLIGIAIIGWILSLIALGVWTVRDKLKPAPEPAPKPSPPPQKELKPVPPLIPTETVVPIVFKEIAPLVPEEPWRSLFHAVTTQIVACEEIWDYTLERQVKAIVAILDPLAERIPRTAISSPFAISFYNFITDLASIVQEIINTIQRSKYEQYDMPDDPHPQVRENYTKECLRSLCVGLSGHVVMDKAIPRKMVWRVGHPDWDEEYTDYQIIYKPVGEHPETYLDDTPLKHILRYPVSLPYPPEIRYAHSAIIGAVRSGKTTLMSHLIGFDIHDPDPPSLILIDPKRLAIEALSRLKIFENSDRLFIISPHYAPAINIFDTTNTTVGIVDSITYLCSMLGQDMTGKQRGLFRNVANLITNFRKARGTNATFFDLKELMVDKFPDQYRDILPHLEPEQRAFFENKGRDFESRDYRDTKDQINTRLNGLTNPHLLPMLRAKESAFNLFEELQRGSVFLIDTAEDILDTDESAMFGVIIIAELMRVIRQRLTLPLDQRRKCYTYIDEAQEFFTSADLLSQFLTRGRQCHIGGVFAFHTLDQAEAKLRSALITNTATKIVGKYAVDEITYLHDHMGFSSPTDMRDALRATPEFHWACNIRGVNDSKTVTISAPEKPLEKYPTMSDAAYKKLLDRNRERVGAKPGQQQPPRQPSSPAAAPPPNEPKEPPHRWTEQDEQALADAEHQCAVFRRRKNTKRVAELEIIIAEAKAHKKASEDYYGKDEDDASYRFKR